MKTRRRQEDECLPSEFDRTCMYVAKTKQKQKRERELERGEQMKIIDDTG